MSPCDGCKHANSIIICSCCIEGSKFEPINDPQGLFKKYIISKADKSPVDPNADYFVLRLDKDPAAVKAVLEYARNCDNSMLAQEIIDRYKGKQL